MLDGYPTVFIDKAVRYTAHARTTSTNRRMPHSIRCPQAWIAAEHTPEAVVERIAASGARCVKVFIEDGFGDSVGLADAQQGNAASAFATPPRASADCC